MLYGITLNIFLRFSVFHSIKALAVEGEMLWLTKITRSEMGIYLCIASNQVPPSVSKRIKLQVHCKYTRSFHMIACEEKRVRLLKLNFLRLDRLPLSAFPLKH